MPNVAPKAKAKADYFHTTAKANAKVATTANKQKQKQRLLQRQKQEHHHHWHQRLRLQEHHQQRRGQQQHLIQHLRSLLVHPLWFVFWHVCISTFVSNHRLIDSGGSGKFVTKVVLPDGATLMITRKDRRGHAHALRQSHACCCVNAC